MRRLPSIPVPKSAALLAVVLLGCGGGGSGPFDHDDAMATDASLPQNGSDGGQEGHPLPSGQYRVRLAALETSACGVTFSGDDGVEGGELMEVQVAGGSVVIAPGTASQISASRQGNRIHGTATREYQVTLDGNLCILEEQDRIEGQVVAVGSFWLDISFSWAERGGVCSGMTLPCAGKQTWTFEAVGHELSNGVYRGEVVSVEEDTCNTGFTVGMSADDYQVTADDGSVTFCFDTGYELTCIQLVREVNTLSGGHQSIPAFPASCDAYGTETSRGEILAPDRFRLTRTRTAASSCGSCRLVFVQEFTLLN